MVHRRCSSVLAHHSLKQSALPPPQRHPRHTNYGAPLLRINVSFSRVRRTRYVHSPVGKLYGRCAMKQTRGTQRLHEGSAACRRPMVSRASQDSIVVARHLLKRAAVSLAASCIQRHQPTTLFSQDEGCGISFTRQ